MKKSVLFVCVHNSALSQMAEALLKKTCGDLFEVESCGIRPGPLNPLAVAVMAEAGLDIAQNKSKSIFNFTMRKPTFDYVITVCDESAGENCPTFPRETKRLQWSFLDPSTFTGTDEEKLARTREVRDAIAARIETWCAEVCATAAA